MALFLVSFHLRARQFLSPRFCIPLLPRQPIKGFLLLLQDFGLPVYCLGRTIELGDCHSQLIFSYSLHFREVI